MTYRNGSGEMPLRWSDMTAYDQALNLKLEPWEFEIIHAMSIAYISYKQKATESRALKSPFIPNTTQQDMINRAMQADKFSTFE
jgi:hypothetical protein